MQKINRVTIIVLDSAGIGALPDAELYGDSGVNTLAHIAEKCNGINLPNMQKLGLGNLCSIQGVAPVELNKCTGSFGIAAELSKGKDTTIGHWEIAGVITEEALPTYPDGFPDEIIESFEAACGYQTIGNIVASGTEIINRFGDEHVQTRKLIVYTSADSVFQIAAHEEVVPLPELYRICEIARVQLKVGRIIARPFVGSNGNYTRTANRHDYSLVPPSNLLNRLQDNGLSVIGVGKIYDIFAGSGVTESVRTQDNMQGVDRTIEYLKKDNRGLIFSNLVDFDMKFGHRRDASGYKQALEEFDTRLPEIFSSMQDDDLLIITADHGCDPTHSGTDHTREYIPLLCYGRNLPVKNLGIRQSFADIAATVENLLLGKESENSFL